MLFFEEVNFLRILSVFIKSIQYHVSTLNNKTGIIKIRMHGKIRRKYAYFTRLSQNFNN